MSWASSFFVAALTGVLGLVVAGLVTAACSEWLNVSNREGAAGYLMVAMALVGGVVGFVLGLVVSRVIAGMPEPGWLKALGYSCGAVLALGGVTLGLGWLKADFEPKIDGRNLALAIEVRTPRGFVLPTQPDDYGVYAAVRVPGARSYSPQGKLDLSRATQAEGRWIVTALVPLITSAQNKVMDVRFSQQHSLTFPLPLRSKPQRSDLGEWSAWVDSGWDVGTAEPPPEKKFSLRYHVQLIEPPPPAPPEEDPAVQAAAADQAKFDALGAHTPVREWFPFAAKSSGHEARRATAIRHIAARPDYAAELGALMTDADDDVAKEALYLAADLPPPQPALLAPVAAAGKHIAGMMRKFNVTPGAQDPSYQGAASVSVRFSAWMSAVRALRENSGGDFTVELRPILELSRVRLDSHEMQGGVRRVASHYMKQWANLDPLPGDPPPR